MHIDATRQGRGFASTAPRPPRCPRNDNPFYGGGGGGGGYMSQNSPFGSGGGSPGGSARRAASHSLRPVTLRQLLQAQQEHSDAAWKIGDVEVGQVMVVAQALSVQAQTTNCVYMLDDGTARFEARQWVDANSDDEDRVDIKEGSYVRVLGRMGAFAQKTYLVATHIKQLPLQKHSDEVFFHALDVAATTLIFERGPTKRGSSISRVANGSASGATSAYAAQSHGGAASNSQFAGLPSLQKSIIEFMLKQPPNEDGINVGAIARHVSSTGHAADAGIISAALEQLMDQGHVYTTIDDSHFNVSA
ncbi:replication protein A subunit RPA32 [Epithele typhae]|uniref:replication protein A subunit RPA32 n=1 Tax=Epithele typhae TaxID=378194 RepID=UPI002007C666|nr:replication protein A subunit RPA32 [Epithele typhae]KAH9946108.1 replication protein A subunit RPA32 [Epithele typhae]